jgi:predicted dehydrogenase
VHRVGIIGGETHIQEVTRLQGRLVEIVGVAVRPDLADWAHQQFGLIAVQDFRRLLADAGTDVIAVANENDLRAEVVIEALRQRKHVIVDKPMALTLDEVDQIGAAANEANRRVLMLLSLRGDPWYRAMRDVVQSGAIGETVQVRGHMCVPLNPGERPPWFLDATRSGGPILDLAIHTFDQVEWVTGRRMTWVSAHEGNVSHPELDTLIDSGTELFGLDNGGTAVVEQNRVGLEYDYRLNVVGTAGQVNLLHKRGLRIQTKRGWREVGPADLQEPVSVVEDWLQSLDGGEALIPDAASFRASRIACLAKQAAVTGTRVTLPGG